MRCPWCNVEMETMTDFYGRNLSNMWYCSNCKKQFSSSEIK